MRTDFFETANLIFSLVGSVQSLPFLFEPFMGSPLASFSLLRAGRLAQAATAVAALEGHRQALAQAGFEDGFQIGRAHV